MVDCETDNEMVDEMVSCETDIFIIIISLSHNLPSSPFKTDNRKREKFERSIVSCC